MGIMKRHISNENNAKRKAETRTKIQLGGLVLKSQLARVLNINVGDELEFDLQNREKALIILGALVDCQRRLQEDEDGNVLREWDYLGKECLSQSDT